MAVGDLALMMVANNLTVEENTSGSRDVAYPSSVIDLVSGMMGQPPGGFPESIKKIILKGKQEFTKRPGETLPPADFEKVGKTLQAKLGREATDQEIVTSVLYPKVFDDYLNHVRDFGSVICYRPPRFSMGLRLDKKYRWISSQVSG